MRPAFQFLTALFSIIAVYALAILLIFLNGCAVYQHSRRVKTDITETPKVLTVTERTTLWTLFKKGEAELIQSTTVDNTNGYSRTIGIANIKTSGDPETVTASGAAAGEAAKTFIEP